MKNKKNLRKELDMTLLNHKKNIKKKYMKGVLIFLQECKMWDELERFEKQIKHEGGNRI